ncbi:lipopolysaccharide biosynthesis protein [Clostridium baratii]|uniref:lipopolysaccharide biosynthesis protein n=1 Tax=Clostridium baratii TaxID=1561 RepID=UPI001C2174CF|nr:hypothetical protein [Clostridium baratii]
MKISLIFYIINVFLAFISRSLFVKILGADINGLNSLYSSLIGFLNVAELGVGVAVGYSLYEPLSRSDFKKVEEIMILFKSYYKNISKIIFVIGTIVSIFLPYLIKGQVDYKSAYLYYFLYLINCSISYLFTYKQTLIIADQKQYKIAYSLNITKIVKIFLQCIALIITKSFFIWLTIEIFFNILGMILANKKVDNEYKIDISFKNKKSLKKIKNENIEIKRNIRNIFFHKIGTFVIFQTDAIVISLFTSLRETGIYANYMMIINNISGLISNVLGSIMPSIGNLIVEESKDKIYDVFKKLYLMDHILALFISVVVYNIINEFIIFWVGEQFLFNKYCVIAIVVNLYITLSRGTVERFKDGFGLYWDIYAPLIESLINLIVSVILTIKIGILGVFIGTIFSNILIVELWKPYILFKEGFKKNTLQYFNFTINILIKNIIIILLSNYLYKFFQKFFHVENIFIKLIFNGVLISIICTIFIFLLYGITKEFKEILKLIKKQLLKSRRK